MKSEKYLTAVLGVLLLLIFSLTACDNSSTASGAKSPVSVETPVDRPLLTRAQCEQSGGTVVGDPGDGSTQLPTYRCPNGSAPVANIRFLEGEPISIEGSVCCPG